MEVQIVKILIRNQTNTTKWIIMKSFFQFLFQVDDKPRLDTCILGKVLSHLWLGGGGGGGQINDFYD